MEFVLGFCSGEPTTCLSRWLEGLVTLEGYESRDYRMSSIDFLAGRQCPGDILGLGTLACNPGAFEMGFWLRPWLSVHEWASRPMHRIDKGPTACLAVRLDMRIAVQQASAWCTCNKCSGGMRATEKAAAKPVSNRRSCPHLYFFRVFWWSRQ
ncbi:hypothetical protein BS50DRAFT_128035 [Corynespora cassiicola Philippines]|uniref:Uncharacterized protein n=1 Tax=Corynespora cassiicola Philippines TaxID=1448308 RepID=A0A2T2NCG1_CORCC|nr:hypothetical protein BS50DRAFT_128035 [Corynespora cassiicola Philippines]